MTATLSDVNAMDEDAFVAAFGGVYEHAPWVARAAWHERPFGDEAELRTALEGAMRSAARHRQLSLVRGHPELGSRAVLTDESAGEQAAAGLDRLTRPEFAELERLNRAYRERFGFPLVVCVRAMGKDAILAWGRERLDRSREQELDTALGEIEKIAALRLGDLVA